MDYVFGDGSKVKYWKGTAVEIIEYGYAIWGEYDEVNINFKDYMGKSKKARREASAFILGIGLHSVQDNFAHISYGHKGWHDKINYGYKGNPQKWLDKNPRYKDTMNITIKYLNEYLKKRK